jgi:lipoprotein-anchoring transpeptidase ErfK/SrfK
MDGKGYINGAYGPYFIRLNVLGQKGIGIHGTHLDSSMGSRASEGCIRMRNEDIEKLIKRIKSTTIVIITPSQQDVNADAIVENIEKK